MRISGISRVASRALVATVLFLAIGMTVRAQGAFTIQVGSVNEEGAAKAAVSQLRSAGHFAYFARVEIPGKGTWYRIRVGRFASSADAQRYVRVLGRSGAYVSAYDGPSSAPFSRVPAGAPPTPKPEVAKTTPPKPSDSKAKNEAASNPNASPPAGTSIGTVPPPVTRETKPGGAPPGAKSDVATKVPPKPEAATVKKTDASALETKKTVEPEKTTPAAGGTAKTMGAVTAESKSAAASGPPTTVKTALKSVPSAESAKPPAVLIPKLLPLQRESRLTPPPVVQSAVPTFQKGGWRTSFLPTQADLVLVTFIDRRTGWAASSRGTVFRTETGGETWTEHGTGLRGTIMDLRFLDARTGWLLVGGTKGLESHDLREDQALLHTTDGGKTWKAVAEMDAVCVTFVDGRTGFAAGNYGAVLKTENGGQTWLKCASPERALGLPIKYQDALFTFTGLQFQDAAHGWALGNFYGEGIARPGGLFYTGDGGQTWERRALPLPGTVQGELTGFRFLDARRGYVTAETYRGDARYLTVFHTADGGATWTERASELPGFRVTGFTGETHGWSVGALPARNGAPTLETGLFTTRDGGRTWKEETTLPGLRVHAVCLLDAETGWAVGENGLLLKYRP